MFRSTGSLPTRQNSSSRRLKPPGFVRQAAKGGILPAERNIKKHHRFFPWIRKHICGCPGRETGRRQGRAGEACGGDFFTGAGCERGKGEGMRELKILPKYKLYDIKIGGRGVYNGIRDIVIFWKNI
ncbi:hypothetical protein BEI60_30415 [Eisenbergiella tayi]|nr:hypothetical protein BEI60_30415 [Eisenbergiella tayi]